MECASNRRGLIVFALLVKLTVILHHLLFKGDVAMKGWQFMPNLYVSFMQYLKI
jgi:hypothetical protein